MPLIIIYVKRTFSTMLLPFEKPAWLAEIMVGYFLFILSCRSGESILVPEDELTVETSPPSVPTRTPHTRNRIRQEDAPLQEAIKASKKTRSSPVPPPSKASPSDDDFLISKIHRSKVIKRSIPKPSSLHPSWTPPSSNCSSKIKLPTTRSTSSSKSTLTPNLVHRNKLLNLVHPGIQTLNL